MITSDKNDTLITILEKIQTPKDIKGKMGVYTLFVMTHSQILNQLNVYIQLMDPLLWEEIRKIYHPTLLEKVKKKLGF